MLKCTPSRYTMRQCSSRGRSRHASNCCVSVWLRRLIALALGATPSNVWATSPTLWVLVPDTNIPVASFGNVRFITAVAFKSLRVEVPFTISGNFEIFDAARRCCQIARVVAVAISFALGAAFSPSHADKRIEFLSYDCFQHHTNGTSGQFAQILLERLLVRQRWDGLLLR